MLVIFFFFKQKTAYEMRISDWSSDVCSSDLPGAARPRWGPRLRSEGRSLLVLLHFQDLALHRIRDADAARPGDRLAVFLDHQIGRASCRERSVSVRVDIGGRSIIKNKKNETNIQKTIVRITSDSQNQT